MWSWVDSGDWFVLRRGPWTVFLAIQKDRRFPDVDRVISSQSYESTKLHWSDADLAFLEKSLKHQPAAKRMNAPITLDANDSIAGERRTARD